MAIIAQVTCDPIWLPGSHKVTTEGGQTQITSLSRMQSFVRRENIMNVLDGSERSYNAVRMSYARHCIAASALPASYPLRSDK